MKLGRAFIFKSRQNVADEIKQMMENNEKEI